MTFQPSTLCLIAQHLDLHVARHLDGVSAAELEMLFTAMNAQSPDTPSSAAAPTLLPPAAAELIASSETGLP